ncbi:MAG: lipid asymmetry maintenance protein MlaB [Gammaproteobacteria bacterium]
MTQAAIRRAGDGRLAVEGELSFATVTRLVGEARRLFEQAEEIRIDLQAITRADSAGLALLVECMRYAQRLGKPIQFLNIPTQMLAIARVSSLDQVLPLSRG